MSKTPIVIGVIVLLLVIVGVVVYFTMMGGEKPIVGPTVAPAPPPVERIKNKYTNALW
jgi:hypothetical protein